MKGLAPDVLNIDTRLSQWSWSLHGRCARGGTGPANTSVVGEVLSGLSTVVQRKLLPLAEF